MTPELTPAAQRALAAADAWARACAVDEPGPVHLLLALVDEEEGRAAELLREQGIALDAVRRQFAGEHHTDRPAESTDEDAADLRPFTVFLRHARRIAEETVGETTVASEHVLLAILDHDKEVRSKLEELGVDRARLRAQVSGLRGQPIPLDEPLELAGRAERVDVTRIIDANANRAREAARVVEDYCRFVLNDACLSRELKSVRHDLTRSLADLGAGAGQRLGGDELLHARNTAGDVGTAITTAEEQLRSSPRHVAQVNLKRLQESLRTLEEYSKALVGTTRTAGPTALESLRYRTYTLEKAILLGELSRTRLASVRLCVLVTSGLYKRSLEETIREAAAGGAEMIQLREKGLSDRELLARARAVRRWTRDAGVLFIVNDRPDICRLADADGVHLGQDDLRVHEARRIIGPDALIGVSTHSLEQLRQAVLAGADYLGVGPTFPSKTKDFSGLAGLELVRQASEETSLPAFAIGGIDADNIHLVFAAGLRRVAVSGAVCRSESPRSAARSIREPLR